MQLGYHMFGEQLQVVNAFFQQFLQALVRQAARDRQQGRDEEQAGSGSTRRMPLLKSSSTPGAARSTKRWPSVASPFIAILGVAGLVSIARAPGSKRMLIAALMGFASGLPLLLTGSVLQAWLKDGGVDLTHIGLFALAGLPYTLKFLWSPLFDRYAITALGRRRGWLLATQTGLIVGLFALSYAQPQSGDLLVVSTAALLVAFFSASQDIVIDAFRVESLDTSEQAAGMASYVFAYRIGMLVSGAGVLWPLHVAAAVLSDIIEQSTTVLSLVTYLSIRALWSQSTQ